MPPSSSRTRGTGTVIRALAAGAPLVCIPLGRDQYDVAARVVWRGAGVTLSARATASALKRATSTVLKNEGFREASQGIAQAISRETAGDLCDVCFLIANAMAFEAPPDSSSEGLRAIAAIASRATNYLLQRLEQIDQRLDRLEKAVGSQQ